MFKNLMWHINLLSRMHKYHIPFMTLLPSLTSAHRCRLPEGNITNWQHTCPLSFDGMFFKKSFEMGSGNWLLWISTVLECSGWTKVPKVGWKMPSLVWLEPWIISQLIWVKFSFPVRTQVRTTVLPSILGMMDKLSLERPSQTEKQTTLMGFD